MRELACRREFVTIGTVRVHRIQGRYLPYRLCNSASSSSRMQGN